MTGNANSTCSQRRAQPGSRSTSPVLPLGHPPGQPPLLTPAASYQGHPETTSTRGWRRGRAGPPREARLGPSSIPGIPEPPRGRQEAACRAAPRGGAGAKKLPEVSGGPRRVAGGSPPRSARPREAAPGWAPGSGGERIRSLLQSNSQ